MSGLSLYYRLVMQLAVAEGRLEAYEKREEKVKEEHTHHPSTLALFYTSVSLEYICPFTVLFELGVGACSGGCSEGQSATCTRGRRW